MKIVTSVLYNIVKYCNENEGFISAVLATISLFMSYKAIRQSNYIMEKQNNITLLEQRYKVFNDIQEYIEYLQSWEFDLSKNDIFNKYSKMYIATMFNKETSDFYVMLENTTKDILRLEGDYEHAKRKGECRGLDLDEIEDIIISKKDEIYDKFKIIKDEEILKFLKI